MKKEIVARLRSLRGDVPQAVFAGRLGMSQSAWHRYETGKNEMGYEQLCRLCIECGVSLDWLFGVGGGADAKRPPAALEVAVCRQCARLRALVEKQSAALADCSAALCRLAVKPGEAKNGGAGNVKK